MRVARRFLLLGGALLAGSAVAVALGDVPIAAGLAVVGLVALLVGRRFRSMEPASIRRGVPGTAEITSVRETGTEVDHVQVVVEATAAVSIAGFAPYEATMRMVLHPSQVESIEPGAVIPVLVEAERPSRVVLDAERGMITRPRPLGGGAHEAARTSADGIVEHGIAVGGILHFSGPTGLVGRDLVPHLRGPGADDPVHQAWSGRRDSNPRPSPWQGDALPAEPRPQRFDRLPADPPDRTTRPPPVAFVRVTGLTRAGRAGAGRCGG
jgi:hypothetical protein